ncbi:MAG: transglycosylase domain-containing protein [Segetibacter sp.]
MTVRLAAKWVIKIPEAYFTKMIEWVWGKERILEVYLNVAEMGKAIFGIEAASQSYFKKPAIRMSRSEAAMIIASLPNPKKYIVKPMSRWVNWKYPRVLQQMRNIEDDPDIQKLLYVAK